MLRSDGKTKRPLPVIGSNSFNMEMACVDSGISQHLTVHQFYLVGVPHVHCHAEISKVTAHYSKKHIFITFSNTYDSI